MRLAGMAAVTCVALAKVVLSAVEFIITTAPATKPVPLTVRFTAGLPATTEAGEMLVITGPGSVIAKFSAFEVRLPAATVTEAVPGCAIRFAGTDAVSCVVLTNVVASEDPFHTTVAPDVYPAP